MTDWIRFAFIVFIIAVDDLLRELMLSCTTTGEFLWHRVRYIVQDKLRSLWRRSS
jgi:hypothetical protein